MMKDSIIIDELAYCAIDDDLLICYANYEMLNR